MSRLLQIADKIRKLPDIESERVRITITERVSQEAKRVALGLSSALKQAPHIDTLTRGRMVKTTNDAIDFSIEQAKSLKKMIRADKFGSEQKISEHLENLSRKLQGLETQRNQIWTTVQSESQKVETILDIATTLGLESVHALTAAINNFKSATFVPPSSAEDVKKIQDARQENANSLTNSGLKGNVKKILEGAIKENGDPKLLLEEDVMKFFNDHPSLWGSFKLKLA